MSSKIGSGPLTLFASLLLLSRPTDVLAQLAFSNVPSTVNEGQEVQISWTGWDGVSLVVVDLVQDGVLVDELLDDDRTPPSTFTWKVELDDDAVGGTYTLRVTSAGTTTLSDPINITDENGVGAPALTSTPAPTSVASNGDNGNNPSLMPSTGLQASSASMAATATTLISSTLLGTTVIITPSSFPSSSSNSTASESSTSNNNSISGGVIAAIVIGTLVGLAFLMLLIWFCRRRTKNSRVPHSSHNIWFTTSVNKKKGGDGSYIQPSALALGAATDARGAPEGMKNSHEPLSPDGVDDVPIELPNDSSSIGKRESGVHAASRSTALGTGVNGVPANTYEMPASIHPGAQGSVIHEAPSNISSLRQQQLLSPAGSSPSDGNHKSPISELFASDDVGTRTSAISSGPTSPIITRKL